jgi:hypothetical protein
LIVSGNIGIGTTTPRNQLDVLGGVSIGSYAGVNSAPTNSLIVSGNVGIGTTTPVSSLSLVNSGGSGGIVFEAGNTSGGSAQSGWHAININGYFNGSDQRINTSKNRWRMLVWQQGTLDHLALDTWNGTTTTTVMRMDVAGTTTFRCAPGASNIVLVQAQYNVPLIRCTDGGTDLLTIDRRNYNGQNFNIGIDVKANAGVSGHMLLQPLTVGNVGIGSTLNPVNKLDVVGNCAIGSYAMTNSAPANGLIVSGNVGINTSNPSSALQVVGTITGTTKNFSIPHPLSAESASSTLVHASIEGPRYDLIYRGTIVLSNGIATVNIDTDAVTEPDCAMSQGTFEALCRNPVFYLQNATGYDRVIATISQNKLNIVCENNNSSDVIHWMVVAERKDSSIASCGNVNQNGYLKTEY